MTTETERNKSDIKGKITISDDILGERSFPATPLALIRDQHRLLCAYRDDGRIPSRALLDDIAAYESILNAEDPERRANEYRDARDYTRMPPQRPRHVAREKGWMP